MTNMVMVSHACDHWHSRTNKIEDIQNSFRLDLHLSPHLFLLNYTMSFLGRGSAPPPGGINPERIEIATAEYVRLQQHGASLFTDIRTLLRLDMITDVFNRLVSLAVSFKLASSMRN